MKKLYTIFTLSAASVVFSQLKTLERVEPMNWYIGFSEPTFQLLIYGKNISDYGISVEGGALKVDKVTRPENKNYQFVDLEILPNARAGIYPIWFSLNGKKKFKYDYVLSNRGQSKNRNQGVTKKDLVYLIMPDRFANGDYKNDIIKGLRENTINRDSMYYRHGGDLQGIINKFDYLKDLGVTAIWNTPEVENDMKSASYHGYAATDLYKIDPRYGTNELYRQYVEEAHKKGLKIIKDVVPNHVGSEHWFVKDMPMKDWVHQFDQFTNTTYRFEPQMDPYTSEYDKKIALDGWFVPTMPDMNQKNPFVKKYFIQNYLWWVEYAGIDGLRIDTYSYNDLDFMAEWVKRVKTEFPDVSVFGETLMYQPSNQAYFTEGAVLNGNKETYLPGITDSALKEAIYEAINGKPTWYDGTYRLYNILAQDYLYKNPNKNVAFLDNHDMSRFYSVVGEDMTKFKSGITLLLTLEKIPQMYYGTEVIMKNFSNPDGLVRSDMKGGWKEDKADQFTAKGRTEKENEAFNYIKKLANYRKNSSALTDGKMMQFYPDSGVYVYFRYDNNQTVMVLFNGNDEEKTLNPERYKERTKGFTKGKNMMTNEVYNDFSKIKIPGKAALIVELQR